mgnify:CR=1 FL=1
MQALWAGVLYDAPSLAAAWDLVKDWDMEGREALRKRCARAEKPVWVSEAGDDDASGLTMARRIVGDVRGLQPSAWCIWQAVDGGAGWGCIDLDLNGGGTEPRMNRKFDMFAQFTRFVRPGADRKSTRLNSSHRT